MDTDGLSGFRAISTLSGVSLSKVFSTLGLRFAIWMRIITHLFANVGGED